MLSMDGSAVRNVSTSDLSPGDDFSTLNRRKNLAVRKTVRKELSPVKLVASSITPDTVTTKSSLCQFSSQYTGQVIAMMFTTVSAT